MWDGICSCREDQSAPETKPVGPELIWRWDSYVRGGATNDKSYEGQGETQPLKNLEDRVIRAAIEAMKRIIEKDRAEQR